MDISVANITFGDDGVCNFCTEAYKQLPKYYFSDSEVNANLSKLVANIKARKKGVYDSIIGLSGGVDSSYIALMAKDLNLNPLCVHFDNGWNSETAVKNIRKIIDATGFDLYTYVIDWPEFRDFQRAFFRAGVLDIEMLTDHAIFAALFKIRRQFRIRTILSGTNYRTEHGMPVGWYWNKMDARNIKAIHKIYGEININTFPTMSTLTWLLMRKTGLGGVYEEPLNLINYKKNTAMIELKNRLDWEYYGGKHYESTFTKFYQAYFLPQKFGIDKRKVHLSSLIRNGEITRSEAISELSQPLYNTSELKDDLHFVLKKLGFSNSEFNNIMIGKSVPHDFYPTDRIYIEPLINLAKKFTTGLS